MRRWGVLEVMSGRTAFCLGSFWDRFFGGVFRGEYFGGHLRLPAVPL
jgi:hypothetical protein